MDGGDGEPSGTTVFIVEDDEDLLTTYELWLGGFDGIRIETATDGETAFERIGDGVDVLVLDRGLPQLSGPELLDRLPESDLPVVVVSAYKPDEHLSDDDVDGYLVKPIDRAAFVDAVKRYLV